MVRAAHRKDLTSPLHSSFLSFKKIKSSEQALQLVIKLGVARPIQEMVLVRLISLQPVERVL